MNIAQTLDRLRNLRDDIRRLDEALEKAAAVTSVGSKKHSLNANVFVESMGAVSVNATRDAAIEMLKATKVAKQAEIDKLQPVVDMANAALKGLLS